MTQLSWFEAEATTSLEMMDLLGVDLDDPVIDIGGGTSSFVEGLMARGFTDVTVLDVSRSALSAVAARIGSTNRVHLVERDLLEWRPSRQYKLWHDRATFHFMVTSDHRGRYHHLMEETLAAGGGFIVATFAEDGPETCSGLPVARYTGDELAAAMGESASIVATRRELHVTPQGMEQPFTWIAGRLKPDQAADPRS